MNSKKANRAFLITVVCYLLIVFCVANFAPTLADNFFVSNLLIEAIVILPIGVVICFSKEKLIPFLGFRKMKIKTVLMTALFTGLSIPFITLLNLISQIWVKNEVTTIIESMDTSQSLVFTLFVPAAVVAPFAEEITCRGMYYHAYKKTGGALKAMLLSALIFAMIHMNLNQAMYAFGMGILSVLLMEATGSLWASILYHGLINGSQSMLMMAMLKANPNIYSEQAELVTTDTVLFGIGVYLIIAAVTLPLAWAVLIWMSGHEGRREEFREIWTIKKDKTITGSLILGLILCVLMMTGILF